MKANLQTTINHGIENPTGETLLKGMEAMTRAAEYRRTQIAKLNREIDETLEYGEKLLARVAALPKPD